MKRLIISVLFLAAVVMPAASCTGCYDRVLRDGTVLHECR